MKASRFTGTLWDGKALYVMGEAGVQVKIGKRDLVRLASAAVMATKFMLVPKEWAYKIARTFKETPARLQAGKAVK